MKKIAILFFIISIITISTATIYAEESTDNLFCTDLPEGKGIVFSVLLNDGNTVDVYSEDTGDDSIDLFIGDEKNNCIIEEILLDDGSNIKVNFSKEGLFSVALNELKIKIRRHGKTNANSRFFKGTNETPMIGAGTPMIGADMRCAYCNGVRYCITYRSCVNTPCGWFCWLP